MLKLIFALIAVAVAVPAGGLLAGVDRRLTARLQSRQGPPLLQPFYDVLKLFGKAPCVTNPWLIFSSYVCLMASAIALLMFFMQGDMLLLFFVYLAYLALSRADADRDGDAEASLTYTEGEGWKVAVKDMLDTPDLDEAVRAVLERRPPEFTGR